MQRRNMPVLTDFYRIKYWPTRASKLTQMIMPVGTDDVASSAMKPKKRRTLLLGYCFAKRHLVSVWPKCITILSMWSGGHRAPCFARLRTSHATTFLFGFDNPVRASSDLSILSQPKRINAVLTFILETSAPSKFHVDPLS